MSKILCSISRRETYYLEETKHKRWATVCLPFEGDRWDHSDLFSVTYYSSYEGPFGVGFDTYEEAKRAAIKYARTGERTRARRD